MQHRNVHLQHLRRMTEFCENQVECRRTSLLEYFGEHFSSEECKETCDNCKSRALGLVFDKTDVTQDCLVLMNMGKRAFPGMKLQSVKQTLKSLSSFLQLKRSKQITNRALLSRFPRCTWVKSSKGKSGRRTNSPSYLASARAKGSTNAVKWSAFCTTWCFGSTFVKL